MTAKESLTQLVHIDSVSSRSNAEIISYLTHRCEAFGLRTSHWPYTDDAGVEKLNLIALAGAAPTEAREAELALVGHTDTVPYDPAWADATNLIEQDGKLFGRGACDTKGFIAAALTAVGNVDLKTLQRPLALVFTADEELGLVGAKHLAAARALQPRYAIVGEPTGLQPMRAGKGYSLSTVTVRGQEAHSAYPTFGSSAIFRAARLITQIEKIATQLRSDQHPDFDPPFTTLNVGLIQGGTAKNITPGECHFTLEWRPVPGQNSTRVLELVKEAVASERRYDNGFECEFDSGRSDAGFETSADSSLVCLLEELTGQRAGTVAFGTEAPQMHALGAEAVVMGPGNIREAHRTGEFVPIAELNRCVEILTSAIRHYCF
jgi:acetylornithine deacetylase